MFTNNYDGSIIVIIAVFRKGILLICAKWPNLQATKMSAAEEFHTSSYLETDDLDFDGKPAGERWAPLGANDPEEEATCYAHQLSDSP